MSDNIQKRQQIAAEILGDIHWTDSYTGYCTCPGKQEHTAKNGRRHCRVNLDGAPTIYCVHESCAEAVAEANSKLRKKIAKAEPGRKVNRRPDTGARNRHQEWRSRAQELLRDIESGNIETPWPVQEIRAATEVPESPGLQASTILSLFDPDGTLWCGDKYDSGRPEHRAHFKSASEWREIAEQCSTPSEVLRRMGPFTVPSYFEEGSQARRKENLSAPCFLVVESDKLTHDQFGAVLKLLSTKLHLFAVVDTGKKSLHGWFEYPSENLLAKLRVMLPVMGCDGKMFSPSQPCRLSGALRSETGRTQELIYFNPFSK